MVGCREKVPVTTEERIKSLEQMIADLANMVANLSWGNHRKLHNGKSQHNYSHELYGRASEQADTDFVPAQDVIGGFSDQG